MRRVNRHVRALNNLGDYIVGDIECAGLLSTWPDILYLKGGADQSPIAQDKFGNALPDGGDLRRFPRVGMCRFSPELECEGLSIAKCHIFGPFLSGILRELRNNDPTPG